MPAPANLFGRACQTPTSAAEPRRAIRLTARNLTRDTLLATYVVVADRGPERRKGLLGRASMDPQEGLWIIPCEAVHTIGMRFPIDVVYLDRDNLVLKVRRHIAPWRLSACLSAYSILELAVGIIDSSHTCPGDMLSLSAPTQAPLFSPE